MDNSPKPTQTFTVNIDNCDKEQIHIPGSVQSFGAIVAYKTNKVITRVSANIEQLSGLTSDQLIGQPLSVLLDDAEIAKLDSVHEHEFFQCITLSFKNGTNFNAMAHSANGERYIDLIEDKGEPRSDYFPIMREMTTQFTGASNETELAQIIAEKVRSVSGFDRVKIYKFDTDWNGEVIAEARDNSMPSYLGLHFPSSDIPKQARELYIRNRLRVIADVNDAQSALIEEPGLKPLDMSFSFVRSVSPIHLQYLRNMEVMSSMSISLFDRNRFWGLIACHHRKPRTFNFHEANFYYSLSDFCSSRITDLARINAGETKEAYLSIVQDMVSHLTRSGNIESLISEKPAVDELVRCTGNAIMVEKTVAKKNAAPDDSTLHSLVSWLERGSDDVFACDDLPLRYSDSIGSYACGLLAARIPGIPRSWMLWFRLEITKEVDWAGDPFKPTNESPYGVRLYPRTSFELWKENRRGHSSPWEPWEQDAARFLAKMAGAVLKQA